MAKLRAEDNWSGAFTFAIRPEREELAKRPSYQELGGGQKQSQQRLARPG